MADAPLRIQSSTSGDTLIDNSGLTVAGSSVRRERIVIGDDNAAGGLAPVSSSGGLLTTLAAGVLTSLTSATVFQGTAFWAILAATSGGAQPVSLQNTLPLSVVASTTGGNIPVLLQNSLVTVVASSTGGSQPVAVQGQVTVLPTTSGGSVPVSVQNASISVLAATSGGSQPVSIQNALISVLTATSGGSLPVSIQNALLVVVASTTGGAIPVASHAVTQGTSPWVTQAATSGGAQPVVQSSTPWPVVASTTGGAAAVSQGTTPWTVVSSSTGGSNYAVVRATQPAALVDAAVGALIIDTKGRQVVTPFQVRQLVVTKYLQVAAVGETVLLASSSGFYRDLLFLCITPATSNTVNSPVTIKDSSGGATQFLLNIPPGSATAISAVLDFPVPWPQTTATSTGNAWTVNFGAAGVYNISALFSQWTS